MKVLTDTLCKEHYDLYRVAQKDFSLLSSLPPPLIITYKVGTTAGVENRNLIHSRITAGTYSIDNFNTKIKEFVLQQRQDWEPPQIKD